MRIAETIKRAMALHQAGRLAEAEGLYRQALAGGGGDAQAHFLLALALHQQQKTAEALAAADAALARDPGQPDALMLRAMLRHGLGQREAALSDLTTLTRRVPGHAQAWFNLGVVLSELDRPQEAVAALDRTLALQPTAMAWNNRGAAQRAIAPHDRTRTEAALESFERAVALDPAFAVARANRGLALHDLGRDEEALAQFDALLAADPRDAAALLSRGSVLQALGRFEEAAAACERLLALRPAPPPPLAAAAWANRGDALARLGRLAPAIDAYDQALALVPDRADTWRRRGEALCRLGRNVEGLASHDRAVQLASGSPDILAAAHLGRTFALGPLGRVDEALAACDAALALTPDKPEAWLRRGVVLHALQRFDEARATLERAAALAPPGDPAIQRALGRLHAEAGRIGEAMAVFADRAAARFADPAVAPLDAPNDPEPKRRHDREQAAYLANLGITAPGYHLEGGERLAGPAVNPANSQTAAAAWAASDPKIVVIDDLLTPPALKALRRFCWGSTLWRKPYPQGYLGAFDYDGFACPLLTQIAEELGEVLPDVIQGHGLLGAWAFKYDSRLEGIHIHADQAAVNVNFWITPDAANRDPAHGGMVIWDKVAPADWEITQYNGDDDAVRAFLAQSGAQAITVPYRANRAVIFDSDLFHETDGVDFEEGYLNRRINVTMLYGRRNFLNR